MDVPEIVKDVDLLYRLLNDMVEQVGEQNVIQVVTDYASNYVKVGKLLEAKRPHLYWTPCATYCIDLMLEDIGKLPKLHTKRRNRSTQSRLNNLVFVKYNQALIHRYQLESTNCILLEEIDKNSEWLLGRMDDNSSNHDGDFVFDGDDLTWSQVSRAAGAHDPSYLTRSSKNLSSTSKGKGVATSSANFAPSSTH
ncbi:hypothetical protein V6N13_142932 [Hibiscus sabdariffa]